MDNGLAYKIKEHDQEIKEFNEVLQEIKASLKSLDSRQALFTSLYEAKIEHGVDIKHIYIGLERVFDELKKIDQRIGKVETILEFERQDEERARTGYGIVEILQNYWQIIIASGSVIAAILMYFFGPAGIKT